VFCSPWAENKELEERHAFLTKEISSWPINPKDPAKHVDKVQVNRRQPEHKFKLKNCDEIEHKRRNNTQQNEVMWFICQVSFFCHSEPPLTLLNIFTSRKF
jgi:hypothetical protein